MSVRRDRQDERGATIVMVTFMLIALTAIAATVIDLAAARTDRASNQVAADAAATAAADLLVDRGGEGACLAAVGYLEDAVGQTIIGLNCDSFPTTCTGATASAVTSGAAGSTTVVLTHPVPDASHLMAPGAIGSVSQPVVAADGDPCDRFAVQVQEVHTTFFGHVVGTDQLTTTIHAVAKTSLTVEGSRAVNLLLLEREDCEVLSVSGGAGGAGGILAGTSVDANGETVAGLISIDSDGSGNCGSKGIININGSNASVRADGEPGCAGELPSGPGHGCGDIEIVANAPSGCALPACSSTGVVAPNPTPSSPLTTRAPVDWRYNCKSSYPASLDIGGCPNSATRPAYIDTLVADVGSSGTPSGFSSYSAAGHPCTVKTMEVVVIPVGNWVVDCDLTVNEQLTFLGGNVVFDGDVELKGQSILRFNTGNTATFAWSDDASFDIGDSSDRAAFVYLRDGELSKGSQAEIELENTVMYVSADSSLDVGGGSGSLRWIAPTTGPFEDLMLWSESDDDHKFAGGSSLELEGVMFAPHATFVYSGNSNQVQMSAQFIAKKLTTTGGGLLELRTSVDRAVALPSDRATLIR